MKKKQHKIPSPELNDKKTGELHVIELFREKYKDFPKGNLSSSESPDFILSLAPRRKIGIELVRLHLHADNRDLYSYENLAACLGHKEEKLELYRKKRLEAYWLILVVQDPAYRPRFNLNNKLRTWEFNTGFNKVFLFSKFSGEIFEMKRT